MKVLAKVAVHVQLRKGREVLFMKRSEDLRYMAGMFGLPSGHIEDDETALDAAVRETLEEVGVVPVNLTLDHAVYRPGRPEHDVNYVDFFYSTTEWRGVIRNGEPEKCSGLEWMRLADLPRTGTIPYVYDAVMEIEPC